MPLIPFPDVPNVAGVPPLNRLPSITTSSNSGVNVVLEQIILSGVKSTQVTNPTIELDNPVYPTWAIVDSATGENIITPDTVTSFEYRNEQKVLTYPIEQGAFASYNKVAVPYDVRMQMVCNGQGKMTREQFISKLQQMLISTDVYDIVTPDGVLFNANLEHYDYRRESRHGVSMITVDAWFIEIRNTAIAKYTPSAQPSGATPVNLGAVRTDTPSAEQTAAFNAKAIQ